MLPVIITLVLTCLCVCITCLVITALKSSSQTKKDSISEENQESGDSPVESDEARADRYARTRWRGVEHLILGNLSTATSAADHHGVIPPIDGARSALSMEWFYRTFGVEITFDECRRFRAFKMGYSANAYQRGFLLGRRIQKTASRGLALFDDERRYMKSFKRRERRALAFEVREEELVDHIRAVVFYRNDELDPTRPQQEMEPTNMALAQGENEINLAEQRQKDNIGERNDLLEFQGAWWRHTFGSSRTVESYRLERAMNIGYFAAKYAGCMRGIDIQRRLQFTVPEE